MKVALEIPGPFGLHHWAIYEKVEIKRRRVLSPRSQYCNTLESGDDGNNVWLVLAGKLMFLKGDADCSRVDFFLCYLLSHSDDGCVDTWNFSCLRRGAAQCSVWSSQ